MKKLIISMVPLCLLSAAVLGFSIPAPAATTNRDIGFNRPTVADGTEITTAHVMLLSSYTYSPVAVPGTDFRFGKSIWNWDFHRPHRRRGGPPTPTPEPSVLILLGLGLAGLAVTRTRMSTNPR